MVSEEDKTQEEWWHPIKNGDGELDWLCDHLGDANAVMARMWKRLCELDPSLPKDGWLTESNGGSTDGE